ncbi:MAG: sigma-70 family RNA polymerase sigma factor [Planctomycetes bacterium]|nr:sigma-70 family RNA polymerase sigma factor [Planctomycetota bacterium]
MSAADDATLDVLLRNRSFVRGLARHLLVDPDAADDVVQQTWIAALRHAHEGRPVERSWLARIARNFAFNRRRDEARRDAREAQAPTFAPLPSPAEIVAAEDERRRVVDAVLALDEPYLTTMLLRYLRDQSESEVATQLGVPVETVRWRLKTARARLRTRLGGDDDAPRSARALEALAGWSAEEAAAAIAGGKGLILFGAGAWMGLVASLVVAVWLGSRIIDDRPSAPSLPASRAPIDDAFAQGIGDASGERYPGATGASSVTRTAGANESIDVRVTPRERVVLGRCVTREGAIVVGARVACALASASTVTDRDGRFSLRLPIDASRRPTLGMACELVVVAEHYASRRVSFQPTSTLSVELGDLELAPAGVLRGRVLDAADRPLPARIDVVRGNPDSDAWWAFELRAVDAPVLASVTAARDGTFAIETLEEGWYALLPSHPASTCDAPVAIAVIANGSSDVVIRMRAAHADERITVTVNDDQGVPLPGARVLWTRELDAPFGGGPTRRGLLTDASGECSVIVPARSTHAFAVTYADGRVASALGVRGGDPRVVLAPEPSPIASIAVVDASTATPLVGARVTFAAIVDAADGTRRRRPGSELARDRSVAAARNASRARRNGDPDVRETRFDPAAFDAGEWSAETDSAGVARVPVPRERFVLEVSHPRFHPLESGPFDAHVVPVLTPIVLTPVEDLHGVVMAAGTPVADAWVRWFAPRNDGRGRGPERTDRDGGTFDVSTRTDGSFELPQFAERRGPPRRTLCIESLAHATTMVEIDPALLAPGGTSRGAPLRIDLAPSGGVFGRVTTSGERAAAGLIVTTRSNAGVEAGTRVAWDGTYRFDALHAGTWSLFVSATELDADDSRSKSATDEVRVDAGAIATHDLAWTPAVTAALFGDVRVDGIARFGTRVHVSPMGRATDVEAIPIERAPVVVDVGPSGSFRTGSGSVGPHLFAVTIDDGSMQLVARRRVSLAPGRNDASLVLDGGTVTGTCGHPNEGHVLLRAKLADGTHITMRTRCAADGSFRVEHVPAGTYRVRGASDAKTIEVHLGATTTVELK